MVDNFEQIKKLLEFRSDDDFYFVQILQRKKDHQQGKVNGTNNNSRLIKAYYIDSIDHLNFVTPEIIQMCQIFNARAGINLNRRSFKKMQLQHMQKCLMQFINGTHNKVHKAYNSVVGAFNDDSDKSWIIDLDKEDLQHKRLFFRAINNKRVMPIDKPKIIAVIPSKTGEHIITRAFDLRQYRLELDLLSELHDIKLKAEIHKNNPTNIYIP